MLTDELFIYFINLKQNISDLRV